MISDALFAIGEVSSLSSIIRGWATIIFGFAMCLGAGNILRVHGNYIRRRTAGRWYFSAVLLSVMFLYIVLGLALTVRSAPYQFMWNSFNYPLAQATYGLVAFFMFSAAVRVFQARNLVAIVLILSAIFVILGNLPFVSMLSPELGDAGTWITNVPSMGALRGVVITAAIGGIVLGLRMLMGRETGYLGRA
jgi:hypothetical protein